MGYILSSIGNLPIEEDVDFYIFVFIEEIGISPVLHAKH